LPEDKVIIAAQTAPCMDLDL